MRGFSKKRILLVGGAVTTIGAAATLLAGATFGFFSSAGVSSGSNTFTAGNVVVGLDGATSVTCNIHPMSPGDNQASLGSGSGQNVACEYDIKYTGTVSAYLGLDLAITGAPGSAIETPYGSTAPTAAQGLYDGSATGLQFDIHDGNSVSYMSGVTYSGQGITGPVTLTPASGSVSVQNILVNSIPFAQNTVRHLVVNYNLPSNAGNAYNLATSHIVLTIHAVQSDNITLPSDCANGKKCSTGMTWS